MERVTCRYGYSHRKRAGKPASGEGHPAAKLTDAQRAEVVRRALAGENQEAVGADYGISQAQVSRLAARARKAAA
jgi:hypothetical protein